VTDAPVIDADASTPRSGGRGGPPAESPDVRLAIEQAAYAVAAGVAECLLQQAATNIVFEGAVVDRDRLHTSQR
jgi:hypothetical protein